MIKAIPELPSLLRSAAVAGKLVPFVGAGASRLAGCPDWSGFANAALGHFVTCGKLNHSQLNQLSGLSPRVKISIALRLQEEHNTPIDFEGILYPNGRDNAQGRRLYEGLSRLSTIFVTTNYDDWLDKVIGRAPASLTESPTGDAAALPDRRNVVYRVTDLTSEKLQQPNTVIHLHGSILDPKSMVLTTQNYIRHYANDRLSRGTEPENIVLSFLTFLFSERNVLFVGYGLEELEILEYVLQKAQLSAVSGAREMRHYILQGFFSSQSDLADSLAVYYRDFGIELIPFLRDHKDWIQLIDIIDEFGQLAPAGEPMMLQKLSDMEALLNG